MALRASGLVREPAALLAAFAFEPNAAPVNVPPPPEHLDHVI
jgi:hypothetical protein